MKGATIVAAVTQDINKIAILRKMGKELPNISLPRQFFVIPELPMMGTGKIDFRTVTDMVHEMTDQSNKK